MKKSRCPMCYQPAIDHCRSCRTTIVRNKRGEADYGYRGTQVVYQRRANSQMDDGDQRWALFHRPHHTRTQIRMVQPSDDDPSPLGRMNFRRKGAA